MINFPEAKVVFLTGLSGSGKTTIANSIAKKYNDLGVKPIVLDGDVIRNATKQFGYDETSRKQHIIAVGKQAAQLESNGNIVIVSLIAPYIEIRNEIRKLCKTFVEIYVSTPLHTCIKRDTKGLYAKAINGIIENFTGITSPYEKPLQPEIIIDTTNITIEETTEKVFSLIEK